MDPSKNQNTKSIEESLNAWRNAIHEEEQKGNKQTGFNLIHERWTPKWKWFRPPRWKIFRWAYYIERRLYYNCYPVSIDTTVDESSDSIHVHQRMTVREISPTVDISFTVNPYNKVPASIIKRVDGTSTHKPATENESDDNSRGY